MTSVLSTESNDGQRFGRRRFGVVILGVIASATLVALVVGFLYWQSFHDTPQYSLALLIDAARENDEKKIAEIVEVDSIVDGFVPQITDKAVELYGRGLPPRTIERVSKVARPVMPALKDRARAQLPTLIRKKTERFSNVPFAAMVIGANRYLDIRPNGDTAVIRSKLPEHSFEVRMRRNGRGWKIVAVRDESLATEIAERVGQEIISVASGTEEAHSAGRKLGVPDLQLLLREAEQILR